MTSTPFTTTLPLSDRYRDAIRFAVALQVPWAVLLMLVLDGGQMARVGGDAMVGFWVGVAVVLLRRPTSPTAGDLLYVRYGYVGAWCVAFAVGAVKASLSHGWR